MASKHLIYNLGVPTRTHFFLQKCISKLSKWSVQNSTHANPFTMLSITFSIERLFFSQLPNSRISEAAYALLRRQQLLFIVDDLCRFILHEVVNINGEFVHPEHELSTDPKYASLHHWENQELRAGTSSVTQRKWCLYSTHFRDGCTLMMHVMILLYDFMLNLWLVIFKKYIHHRSQNPQ